MNLKDLLVEEKTVVIDYPGCEGFQLTLAYLGKETLNKLRKNSTVTTINKKTRKPEEEVDPDLFSKFYIQSVIKGWTGLKYKYLVEMLPVNIPETTDMEDELAYSEENAQVLLKNSADFDTWVAEIVGDLQNFTKNK